ncbi:MAG TPA: hypothetical protein VHF47_08535, partial [Acidimicrobiales bacterium]|nr:hypothetical protein [Acidimicrobiales bacterium]
GRVMALYSLVLVGSTPIGGPLTGWVAEHFGARVALGAGGVGTVAAVAIAVAGLVRRDREQAAEADDVVAAAA